MRLRIAGRLACLVALALVLARFLGRDLFNAQWNDDIHHALHVLFTGETEGYYADYAKDPLTQLGCALAEGFVFQGEPSPHRGGERRGEPSAHLPPHAFIAFLQNHDQIGNRAMGERLSSLVDGAKLQMAASLLLLSPQIPLLFMGEEWATQTPFFYFCDFEGELAEAVRNGRRDEFQSFAAFADDAASARIPDPNDAQILKESTLRWQEQSAAFHQNQLVLTRRALALRQSEIVPLLKAGITRAVAARIGDHGLHVRWQVRDGRVLQLDANFSDTRLELNSLPKGLIIWGEIDEASIAPWQCLWTIGQRDG